MLRSEELRRGEQLLDGDRAHRAGARERRVEHVVGADQRAGVRLGGARALGVPARLHHDHRLEARGDA